VDKEYKMNTRTSEKGQAIVLIAAMIVGLVGMTAIAVDGGRVYAERRSVQNAADNAALAGALAKCYSETVSTAAMASAASNGFNNDGVTNSVSVMNPPTSGPYSGKVEYVEVVISSSIDTAFAQVVYSGDFAADAGAMARCRKQFDYAVIALDTSNTVRGIQVVGSGDLIVDGGGVISNSSHPTQSLYENGSGFLIADPIHASGGIEGDGFCYPGPSPNCGEVRIESGVAPVADPLVGVPPPALQPMPAQSTPFPASTCTTSNGHSALSADFAGNKDITLYPGRYCLIRGDSGINFTLSPGIYYIDGPGGFEVTANSTIVGDGVMIYLSPQAGPVTMTGNGLVDITAMTSGPYKGMLFYADRSYTNSISMTGNATWNAVGTIYAASSYVDLSGNGDVNNLSSMLVAKTIKLGGNSDVVVNYDPGLNYQPPLSVQLVE
jgi:hypothetical protein